MTIFCRELAGTMKLIKKVFGGVLLTFGSVLLLAIAVASVAEEDVKERTSLIAGGLILGLPPAVLGGWLVRSAQLQQQQEQRDRLRSVFLKLLKQGNGRITALQFSMATGLDGREAKTYLDERSREFSADFEVTENGDLFYRFNPGILQLPVNPITARLESSSFDPASGSSLSEVTPPGSTFDVILETVPQNRQLEAIKIVRELTRLGLKEAKELVEAVPVPIKERVSDTTAQEYRRKLEAIGATVMVIASD